MTDIRVVEAVHNIWGENKPGEYSVIEASLPRVQLPVVDKLKLDMILQASLGNPLLCKLQLLLTQCNACVAAAREAHHFERKTTPTKSNLQHMVLTLDTGLAYKAVQLTQLGSLK